MRGERIAGPGGATGAQEGPLRVPDSVPVIERDELEAATRRSARARRLHARLEARAAEGRPLGAREVDEIVRDCRKPDGNPDGEQAVVLAEHARRNPQVFGGGHAGLLRLFARVAWRALIGDLRAFIARVREQEADARRREELRVSLEEDRVEQEVRRAQLLKHERLAPDVKAPPLDEKLDADQRLRRTLEAMKRR